MSRSQTFHSELEALRTENRLGAMAMAKAWADLRAWCYRYNFSDEEFDWLWGEREQAEIITQFHLTAWLVSLALRDGVLLQSNN